ncbi:MAG: hypothetical protein ABSC26_05285 [Stellaceae bacterium]
MHKFSFVVCAQVGGAQSISVNPIKILRIISWAPSPRSEPYFS